MRLLSSATGFGLAVMWLWSGWAAAQAAPLPAPAEREIDFVRDVKPIFERSCFQCHGPEKPKSGFRLDTREGLLAGGDNGKAIIPGDSTNSVLIQVVAGTHSDIEQMPPKGKGEPLSAEEISVLRAWIDQGAKWPEDAVAARQSFERQVIAAPGLRWIAVSGDSGKFREHAGTKDGFQAGLERFLIQDRLSSNETIRVEGRLWPEEDNLRLAVRYDRQDVWFVDAGVDQYTTYYDDSGGYHLSLIHI